MQEAKRRDVNAIETDCLGSRLSRTHTYRITNTRPFGRIVGYVFSCVRHGCVLVCASCARASICIRIASIEKQHTRERYTENCAIYAVKIEYRNGKRQSVSRLHTLPIHTPPISKIRNNETNPKKQTANNTATTIANHTQPTIQPNNITSTPK